MIVRLTRDYSVNTEYVVEVQSVERGVQLTLKSGAVLTVTPDEDSIVSMLHFQDRVHYKLAVSEK